MKGTSRSTLFGFLILVALWVVMAIHWPRPAARQLAPAATPLPTMIIVQPGFPLVAPTPAEGQLMPMPATPPPQPIATEPPPPTAVPPLIVFVPHVIQSGENLELIAAQHNTSTTLLAIYLHVDELRPGNTVQVPVPNPAACLSGRVHVVEKGQTLYRLSVNYSTTVDAIKSVNGLIDDLIRVGQVLCIP